MVPHRGYNSRRQCLAKKPQCSSLRQYPVLEVLLERWGEEQEQERREPSRSRGDGVAGPEGQRPQASPRDHPSESSNHQPAYDMQVGMPHAGGDDEVRRWHPQGLMFNAFGLPLRSHHMATLPEVATDPDPAPEPISRRPLEEASAPSSEPRSTPHSPPLDRGRHSSGAQHEFLHEERLHRRQTSPAPSQWSLVSFSSLPTEQSVELSEAQDPSERASERMSERDLNLDQAPSERDPLTSDDEGSLHSALLSRRSGDREPVLFHSTHRE